MDTKRIENLLNRIRAMHGTRLRVVYADGETAVAEPAAAIPLLRDKRPIARMEALGDMDGQGHLLDLLNGLCGGDDEQDH